jgi:23S rRNA (guanosine2251-2'-O)-methyltransferase
MAFRPDRTSRSPGGPRGGRPRGSGGRPPAPPRRFDRRDRPGGGERPERPFRAERSDRDDRVGREDRYGRPQGGERMGRPARFNRPERPQRFDRPQRFERMDRFERSDRGESADRGDERPARRERFDRFDRGDRFPRPSRPLPGDRRGRPVFRGPDRSRPASLPPETAPVGEAEQHGPAVADDLVWGRHAALAALESGRPIHRIWCTPEMRCSSRFLQLLREAKAGGVLVEEVTWARLAQLCGGAVHQGIVLPPRPLIWRAFWPAVASSVRLRCWWLSTGSPTPRTSEPSSEAPRPSGPMVSCCPSDAPPVSPVLWQRWRPGPWSTCRLHGS